MGVKVMWAVLINGINTDIHGVVYTETFEKAVEKMREIIRIDLKRLEKEDFFPRDYQVHVEKSRRHGYIYGMGSCADDWDHEKGVDYRICRKRRAV